jgi:regulator of protease activity HflC (stomatin/prohibitin superfamily)
MSSRALEFVENWVSEKIEAKDFSTAGGNIEAKAMAAQCVQDARRNGIGKPEIDEAFDDLAAFIAGEIEEARNRRADRSNEKHPGNLIEDDDARAIDDQEDEAEKDAKGV